MELPMAQPKRVNSLIRGLEILESFTPSDSHLTLQELSTRTGLPKTTVHRFLKTLLTMNYVTLDQRSKAYSLAPRVMALGFSVLSGMDLRAKALHYMESLSRETDQNVNLAVLDRTEMLYIERITVRRIINTNLYVGSRVNCYLTAMGRSFIAFLSRDNYDKLLMELLKDREAIKHIGKKGETLEAILEEVRLKGYASNDGEWVKGLRAISAPILNDRGEVEASLNMSFISQMVSFDEMIEKYVPPLMETARKISAVLGYDGAPQFGR
jgi:IclR family pca regulon transcriptional regulator